MGGCVRPMGVGPFNQVTSHGSVGINLIADRRIKKNHLRLLQLIYSIST